MTKETQEFECTLYEKEGNVARVILNRPEKLNVLSREMYRDVIAAMDVARADDEVKVVILKGAGRCFCAGHDVSQVGFVYGFGSGAKTDRRPAQRTRLSRDFDELTRRFQYVLLYPKVTIAQVHGYCIGGARRLVMNCDLLMAAEDAEFSWADQRMGFADGSELWATLHLGPKKARELALTGGKLSGTEAAHYGLANHAVPLAELEAATEKLARIVSRQPRDGIAIGKARRYVELEQMGVAHDGVPAVFHAMFTNLRWEPDEANFYKERRDQGVREAIHTLTRRFEQED